MDDNSALRPLDVASVRRGFVAVSVYYYSVLISKVLTYRRPLPACSAVLYQHPDGMSAIYPTYHLYWNSAASLVPGR